MERDGGDGERGKVMERGEVMRGWREGKVMERGEGDGERGGGGGRGGDEERER